MAKTIARNDPCPCGSGEKYKKCCLGAGGAKRQKQLRAAKVALVVVVVAALGVAMAAGSTAGLLTGAIGLVAVGGYVLFTDPPPPKTGGGDPGAINFGG